MDAMQTFVRTMSNELEREIKTCMNYPKVSKAWTRVEYAVNNAVWNSVEKELDEFEKALFNTLDVDLKRSAAKFPNYHKAKQEMLLNIKLFKKGDHSTIIKVGQKHHSPQDKLEKDYYAEGRFMLQWLVWFDEEVVVKPIKTSPSDPKDIERKNVPPKVLNIEDILKRATKVIINLRNEKQEAVDMNQELKMSSVKEEKQIQTELITLKSEIQELSTKLKTTEEEKEYWMNRMSKVAGNKLAENNPAITDLSDANRPQKIAEKYAELYDNEWTDAQDKLKAEGQSELERISKLLQILKTCHQRCRELASNQLKQLYQILTSVKSTTFDISENTTDGQFFEGKHIPKSLLDVRKETSITAFSSVKEVVLVDLQKLYANETKLISNFVDSCIEIAWKMVVQSPELHFEWPRVGKEATFNSEQFSHYTRSGRGVEFVVWPAMLLHENGPLLRKGTLQPFASGC